MHGGESVTALTVVFNTGEATVRREIITKAGLHPKLVLTRRRTENA